jgi:hypothetical protein
METLISYAIGLSILGAIFLNFTYDDGKYCRAISRSLWAIFVIYVIAGKIYFDDENCEEQYDLRGGAVVCDD